MKTGNFGFNTPKTTDANTTYTAGDGITLNGTEFDLDAIQTIITSIVNAALKMGRDADNLIDFATTDNKIILRVNGVNEVELSANNLSPVTDDGCALGTTSLQWSDLFLVGNGVINFANGGATIHNNAAGQLTIATSDAARGVIIPSRRFGITSSTHGETDGDVVNFGSGSVVAGKCYYLSGGAWALADRRAEASATNFLAVALATGTASSVGMCIRGMVTMASDTGTRGEVVYLRIAGDFEDTATTTSGDFVRIMGYCLDDTNGQMFFNPSTDWVEIA